MLEAARKMKDAPESKKCECPKCGHEFDPESESDYDEDDNWEKDEDGDEDETD